jgi:general secretion pathway protein C
VRASLALRRYSRLGQVGHVQRRQGRHGQQPAGSLRALRLLLIALTAYGAALAINSGIAIWLERGLPIASTQRDLPDTELPATLARTAPDHSAIFERNLFGSEPIIVSETAAPAISSTGELLLRGTAELDGRAFAVFEDASAGKQDVFAIGERVFGGPKLVAVRSRSATILLRGRKTTLEIAEGDVSRKPRSSKKASAAGPGNGIRKTGENSYVVDRREVDHSVENLNTVITQVRALPYLNNGKSVGFRLFNIKPQSIFERMGLQNGDVVQKINGVELNSPSKAVGLLEEMQTSDELLLDLLRAGAPRTLTYAIQ